MAQAIERGDQSIAKVKVEGNESKDTALAPPRTRGKTFISDEVVSVIARLAAETTEGIYSIGQSNLRTLLSRLGRHHGIDSEVGMREAAVDVEVVVEFGYPIREVAQNLRETIIETVERMTGRTVVEVDISVVDVHVESRGSEKSTKRQLA